MTFSPVSMSYLLASLAVPLVLHFHLLPTVIAGFAVHVLTAKLANRLPSHLSRVGHGIALAGIVLGVMLGLMAVIFGIWSILDIKHGMAALFVSAAETLDNIRRTLPDSVSGLVPDNIQDLKDEATNLLREHGNKISSMGMAGFKTFAHVIMGMVVGGLTSLHLFERDAPLSPFCAAIHARTRMLGDAFDKVVFAQVKISLLNTFLTALYLLLVLPLFGVHLPLLKVLIPLTFIAGLLPVVGNLVSNIAIVLISLGESPIVAVASLVFLVLIHKLEYFANARIVGGEVHASAWELLSAMLVMEAIFGLPGMVAAPVVYAWLKAELQAADMV